MGENKFTPVSDWTVNQVGSKASRHYIYGAFSELKELTAHLCNICPRFAELVNQPDDAKKADGANKKSTNTLAPPNSIQYASAPEFSEKKQDDNTQGEHSKKADAVGAKKKTGYKMSTDEVNELFDKKGFATDNLCLKRAVLCGFVKIDDDTSKNTVLFSGSCMNCDGPVQCTFGDALDQSCYAGLTTRTAESVGQSSAMVTSVLVCI